MRRANQLAPEKAQVHYYLSLILMLKGEELKKKGEPDQAKAAFAEAAVWARKVLAVTPDNGLAYMTLGKSLKHLGERADALAALCARPSGATPNWRSCISTSATCWPRTGPARRLGST